MESLGRVKEEGKTVPQLLSINAGFCGKKQPGILLLLLDGMLVHHRLLTSTLPGFPINSQAPGTP